PKKPGMNTFRRKVQPHAWVEFKTAYAPQADKPGLHLIEIKTDRQSRVQLHRDMLNEAVREVKKQWEL
ncbi:hypothetical protein ES071_20180, partial [Bacillus velezensis]|uniref:hypothetical protein n=1 Tax=Bacillus velezensis TaxID=492670 RepID=UPI00102E5E44